MQFVFDEKIENFLKIILKNAQKQNIRVFFIGGIVRDYFLNKKTKDIDLLVMANAIDFAKSFKDEIKIKSIHEDFATVKLSYKNLEIDIASTRREKYPYSGCLPFVEDVGVNLAVDFKRRDFTINSIYCELKLENDKITYEMIDLSGGADDIKEKKLKVLHDMSYVDDPSRIIRGVGFKYRFGFDFSFHDKKLIENFLSNINYEKMSKDRLVSEFFKVLSTDFGKEIFREIIQKKYYKIIQKNDINPDVERIFNIIEKFGADNFEAANFYLDIFKNSDLDKIIDDNLAELYKKFAKFSLQNLMYYYYKTNDSRALWYIDVKNIKLIIKGADLLDAGFCEGKKIGEILSALFTKKLQNPDKFLTKRDELDWVLKNFHKK